MDTRAIRLHHYYYSSHICVSISRYYVQLPTTKAHEYHDQFPVTSMQQSSYYTKPDNLLDSKPQPAVVVKDIQSPEMLCMDGGETPGHNPGHKQHIHPKVADKITELVSHGMVNAYVIRQNLRQVVFRVGVFV